jgi:hypothetical protein
METRIPISLEPVQKLCKEPRKEYATGILMGSLGHVSERFDGCSVVEAGAVVAACSRPAACWRLSSQVSTPPGGGRDAVCGEDRLSVATVAHGFSALKVGPRAVPRLARERSVGAGRQGAARTSPEGTGTKCHAHRGDYRLAVGQDGAKRGRRGYDAARKSRGASGTSQ